MTPSTWTLELRLERTRDGTPLALEDAISTIELCDATNSTDATEPELIDATSTDANSPPRNSPPRNSTPPDATPHDQSDRTPNRRSTSRPALSASCRCIRSNLSAAAARLDFCSRLLSMLLGPWGTGPYADATERNGDATLRSTQMLRTPLTRLIRRWNKTAVGATPLTLLAGARSTSIDWIIPAPPCS